MAAALERLATDPASIDCRKLAGRASWRLRVGQWRVILSLRSDGVMLVQRVLRRNEGTYR
jgi:mRNA-degrading endonuclease RelE of RelBE toxin-antitoxin system